jgi:hypothetical protein
MATTTTTTNKPLNPRAQDLSPKGYNRAALYSGKALDFDGVNDYVDGGTLDITAYTQMSVSFYMNVDTTTQDFRLISIRYIGADDIRIFHSISIGAGVLNFSLDDGDVDNIGVNFETNQWYHVVMTHDGTTLKAYFNGVEQASTASTFDYANANGLFYVGRYTGGAVTYYDGEASNVKIFNTALTAAQVADLYLNPEKIVPDGVADSALKLWLPMMEGAGTTAYDGSGNGNHGTIDGATWVSGIGAPVAQTALVSWNKGTNLVPYSEQFDNAGWSKTRASVTANAATSPDGYANADAIIADSVNDDHFVGQNISVTNATAYSFSAFLKKGNKNWARLWNTSVGYADFDLTNGVVGTQSSATGSIENFGNGWYRCTILYTASSTSAQTHRIYTLEGDNNKTFAGDGLTTNLYVYGAQLEAVDSLGPYIPTLSTAPNLPSPPPSRVDGKQGHHGCQCV